MKKTFFIFFLICLFTSCGSLTKMRYSRGYKCNIEFYSKKDKNISERPIKVNTLTKAPLKTCINSLTTQTEELKIVEKAPIPPLYGKTISKQGLNIEKAEDLSSQKSNLTFTKKKENIAVPQHPKKKLDPFSFAAGLIFYSGVFLLVFSQANILYTIAGASAFIFVQHLLIILAVIFILTGLILAIVGANRINRSKKEKQQLSGLPIDISIFAVFGVLLTITLIIILIIITLII